MNAFAVVEFVEEGSLETIPIEWLTPAKSHALWPECKNYAKIKKCLKGDFNLEEGKWSHISIRIMGYAESYSSGKKLEKKAKFTSNCETDVDETSRKRKRRRRKFSSSSDSSEEATSSIDMDTSIPTFPEPNYTKTISCSKGTNDPEETLDFNTESCLGLLNYKQVDVTTDSSYIEDLTDYQNDQTTTSHSICEMQTKSQLQKNEGILKKILKRVEENAFELKLLRQENSKLHTAIAILSASPANTFKPDLEINMLPMPVTSTEELLKMEEFLRSPENFSKMVLFLRKVGGGDIKNAVRNCMNKVFGSQYSRQYSLVGRKGKLAFCKLKLYQVVLNAVQMLTDSGEEDVNKRISIYLSGAGDRYGGRKDRITNKN